MGEARMRKLSALAFCNLLSTTNPVVLQRMPVLMGAITMVLPDVESERGYEYVLPLFLTLLLKAIHTQQLCCSWRFFICCICSHPTKRNRTYWHSLPLFQSVLIIFSIPKNQPGVQMRPSEFPFFAHILFAKTQRMLRHKRTGAVPRGYLPSWSPYIVWLATWMKAQFRFSSWLLFLCVALALCAVALTTQPMIVGKNARRI